MGLAGLDAALSGLRTYQKQIEVISTNVANVGTEGYTRKILPQSSQAIQGETVGVLQETIVRRVDLRLTRDLWTQVSSVGFYDVQEAYLNRIDQFHGDPAAEISVASEISRLRDSFPPFPMRRKTPFFSPTPSIRRKIRSAKSTIWPITSPPCATMRNPKRLRLFRT